eukprot:CAMPEP_0202704170 /NCGR_PEP_ID=MMETSP1385-20130828/16905_1 /ASSEMBLY_ACC=CAM_ASM_000861 /TAXON_ID=933848 /ORGANISM="Elphidium margaritaceum" /LENGTH=98 /DNA_ID=CAMNT_0049362139 /DNA_START=112 /DNA_END=408 /DNA_ORIENTATION=-
MGGDEIQSLPFASDRAVMNFAAIYSSLVIGHVAERWFFGRRNHIRAFRYAAWVVPLSVAFTYTATPALPAVWKDWFWSFGTRGRFLPPYDLDEEEPQQ